MKTVVLWSIYIFIREGSVYKMFAFVVVKAQHQTCNMPWCDQMLTSLSFFVAHKAVLILCLRQGNERRRYKVTPSVIGLLQT